MQLAYFDLGFNLYGVEQVVKLSGVEKITQKVSKMGGLHSLDHLLILEAKLEVDNVKLVVNSSFVQEIILHSFHDLIEETESSEG